MKTQPDFKEFYNSYFEKIHQYLVRLVGPYLAEDVAQEVFNKAHKNMASLKEPSKVSQWLYKIATNTAIDKTKTLSYTYLDKKKGEVPDRIHDQNVWTGKTSEFIDQKIINEQMRSCVQEFIDRLPADFKTVLLLKDYESKSNKEIADILNITVATVKIRYHRAKEHLKKELDAGCNFFYDDENNLQCDRKQK